MSVRSSECSICLQGFVHPAELPCGHVFCFLCIKGCAFRRRRCPMCRQRFSSSFFDSPKLIIVPDAGEACEANNLSVNSLVSDECPSAKLARLNLASNEESAFDYTWFYEGFDGWWQYDERTSEELEAAFSRNVLIYEVTVAGYVYVIDFEQMTQVRKDRSGRKRRIKRDLATCDKKGIAGIRLPTLLSSNEFIVTNNDADIHKDQKDISPVGSMAAVASGSSRSFVPSTQIQVTNADGPSAEHHFPITSSSLNPKPARN